MTYTVKEIAAKMGITEHAVRFYTDQGLLPCVRDRNNRRVFNEVSVNWLRRIHCLRSCGVSVESLKAFSKLCRSDSREALEGRYQFMKEQQALAYRRLEEAKAAADYIDQKVRHYEDVLAGKAADDTNPSTKNRVSSGSNPQG